MSTPTNTSTKGVSLFNNPNIELEKETLTLGGVKLTVETLKDLNATIDQLFSRIATGEDPELMETLCPYFGVVWPAARALTTQIAAMGQTFLGARVCEIGCGLGLPSLYLAKTGAQVVATDFHPDVERFIVHNRELNGISGDKLKYIQLDWCSVESPQGAALRAAQPFDWVIGSDILYERAHPAGLARALATIAGKHGRILIADPLRPYLQAFVDEMKLLGYRYDSLEHSVPTPGEGPKDVMLLFFTKSYTDARMAYHASV